MAAALLGFDALCSPVTSAYHTLKRRRYVRPQFVGPEEEPQLVIEAGRHPILDAALVGTQVEFELLTPNNQNCRCECRKSILTIVPFA